MVGDADGAGVRVTVGLGDGSMRRCHTCTQGAEGLQVHAQLNRWSHLQARISQHTGLNATSFMAYGTLLHCMRAVENKHQDSRQQQ
jgi:hypothetical protein